MNKTVAKKPTQRRQRRGAAWYWKQTQCWYYTPSGSKRREALLDGEGRRIRGVANKQAARLALARVRLRQGVTAAVELSESSVPAATWTVARVCSEYITFCEQAAATGRVSSGYHKEVARCLNELCRYCGALTTAELKRGDVASWVESRSTWRSPAMRRNVLTMILAAFNYVQREHGVRNVLKGMKKPPAQPRLQSIAPEDEPLLYGATDESFGNFVFAAIQTGLRPFCELAKLRAEDVEETPRGMMWRV